METKKNRFFGKFLQKNRIFVSNFKVDFGGRFWNKMTPISYSAELWRFQYRKKLFKKINLCPSEKNIVQDIDWWKIENAHKIRTEIFGITNILKKYIRRQVFHVLSPHPELRLRFCGCCDCGRSCGCGCGQRWSRRYFGKIPQSREKLKKIQFKTIFFNFY